MVARQGSQERTRNALLRRILREMPLVHGFKNIE
jgi:hypothetical protein